MGASHSSQTKDELAFLLRRQNVRAVKKIYKVIEAGYLAGHLQEVEYFTTIGWYHGLKHRFIQTKDPTFLTALETLNDCVCQMLQDRIRIHENASAANDKSSPSAPSAPSAPANLPSTIDEQPQIAPYRFLSKTATWPEP